MDSGVPNTQGTTVQDWLREGIAAAKAGQREHARSLLMRVVEADEEAMPAWLWLSSVVDSLDDKEVCLENVLALDPANEAARKGLAWVRQQKGSQPIPPPPPATDPPPAKRAASAAAAVLSGEFEQRYSIPKSELAPTAISNEFDDEYLCPYCAAPTRPEDNKCRSCGGNLWVKIWRQQARSCLFRFIWIMQACNAVWYGLTFVVFLLLLIGGPSAGTGASGARPIPPETFRLLPLWVTYSLAMCVYSVVVFIGLYLRWMVIFYLYVINTLLTLGTAIVLLVLTYNQGPAIMCGGGVLLIALVQIGITFALEKDFAYDKRRILLRTDSDAIGAIALLDSGRRYAKRGMWALAAIHLQRAVQMMPGELDYHLMLAGVYINLKRYQLADKILTQAKRINPYDSQLERLAAIVAERGGGQV